MDIHTSALKHGVSVEDIEHAVRNAMAIDDLEDDVRLYLGADRKGDLLEVVAINRRERSELVIRSAAC
ncbi:MAG: hypothetical protein ACE1Y8_01535 [Acidimicrobiia bacterium]